MQHKVTHNLTAVLTDTGGDFIANFRTNSHIEGYILLSEMLSRQNSVLKIEMWLAVQYWEMFYNDNSEDEQNDEDENQDNAKKVTFSDQDDVKEVMTENQYYSSTTQKK